MKIALLGAEGKIGLQVLELALQNGHEVVAYLKNSNDVTISHPQLTTMEGALTNIPKLGAAINGADAVVSALEVPNQRSYEGMPLYYVHKAIISLMRWNNIKRFITIATAGMKFNKDKIGFATVMPKIKEWLLFPKAYKEELEVSKVMQRAAVDWTVVRVIAPVDATTKPAKVTFGDAPVSFSISRKQIAQFILNELQQGQYIKSMPIIGS